ncbi:thioredoxin family protein [Kurthia sibirica]|uniref:Thioredoxin n=1 Tax=Kurthia sibirica TaxID=202750 RepID=A0A2U3AH66_9BACL|nr:thioredoxin family protein [Kurthia sibirica]PWI23893.1 thioredoxin [Kurthia sibirica]GEK34922.1 thioredoxin [Kurthia sibirica]
MAQKKKQPLGKKKKQPLGKKKNNAGILIVIIVVVVAIFAALFFINKSQNDNKIDSSKENTESGLYGDYTPKKQSTIDQLDDKNYQNIILPDALDKKIKSGEGVFAYFFSPECVHCQKVTPELMPLAAADQIHIDQYNVLEFEQGWTDYNLEATPTLAYYKDGKEVGRIVGEQPKENFTKFFKDMKNSK